MSIPVLMPQIGQDVTTAVIAEWLVSENDQIAEGDVICNVEGDKGVFEVEAEASGTVLKILYQAGSEVEVLKPIAYLSEPGEKVG